VLTPHASPSFGVVETGGDLIAVELATGAVRWALPTGAGNRMAPVLTGGLVVAGTTFGQLVAVRVP
jgi:hypothetical protein